MTPSYSAAPIRVRDVALIQFGASLAIGALFWCVAGVDAGLAAAVGGAWATLVGAYGAWRLFAVGVEWRAGRFLGRLAAASLRKQLMLAAGVVLLIETTAWPAGPLVAGSALALLAPAVWLLVDAKRPFATKTGSIHRHVG